MDVIKGSGSKNAPKQLGSTQGQNINIKKNK